MSQEIEVQSETRERERPDVSVEVAKDIIKRHFGLEVLSTRELHGYDTKNFAVSCDDGRSYLLKVSNSVDSRREGYLEMQNKVMLRLLDLAMPVPRPHQSCEGRHVEFASLVTRVDTSGRVGERRHAVRLFSLLPGEPLASSEVQLTASLLFEVGQTLARFDSLLSRECFDLAGQPYAEAWSFLGVRHMRDRAFVIDDAARRQKILSIVDHFEAEVAPLFTRLTPSVIHGDPNVWNILVDGPEYHVSGLVDWEECQRGCAIFDLALACTYIMVIHSEERCPGLTLFDSVRHCVKGYCSLWPLPQSELCLLPTFIITRLAQECCLPTYTVKVLDPEHSELLSACEHKWDLLYLLSGMSVEELADVCLKDVHEHHLADDRS